MNVVFKNIIGLVINQILQISNLLYIVTFTGDQKEEFK